jgi:beta-N-acetylhexosaminidase
MAATTITERVGGMFLVGIRGAEPGEPALEDDLDACGKAGIGGVVLFSEEVPGGGDRNIRSPEQLAGLTAHIRRRLGGDTLIAIDQEGGAVSRLGPAHGFAPSVSPADFARLGPAARRAEADRLAAELASGGINWNLAPCVDLDHTPPSPVIGALGRAFAEDRGVAGACAREFIAAHRAHGIGTCLKHFPGHGASAEDSHFTLPDVTARHRGEAETGVFGDVFGSMPGDDIAVMTAHVFHRGLDDRHPASLSRAVTTDLLRGELGFEGVIATDSVDMMAVRETMSLLEVSRRAILAGADIIIDGCNGPLGDRASDVARVVHDLTDEAVPGSELRDRIDRSADRRSRFSRAVCVGR